MTETLQVGGLRFEVRRSERRKTLGLTVDRAGELVAHAPAATSADELSRWISKKLLWAHRKLALKQEAAPRMRGPEYVTGEAFCYLGRRYRLKIVELQKQPLQFDGSRFTLRRDAQPAGSHFRQWYLQVGTPWLRRRADTLSPGRRPSRHGFKFEIWDSACAARTGCCFSTGRFSNSRCNWWTTSWPTNSFTLGNATTVQPSGKLWPGPCLTGRSAKTLWQARPKIISCLGLLCRKQRRRPPRLHQELRPRPRRAEAEY